MHLLLLTLYLWQPGDAVLPPDLDLTIARAMRAWNVPGLAVGVVADDKVVLTRGYGKLVEGGDRLVDKHTIFAIGSTTKAFTATALSWMIAEGKLAWDDPAAKHLEGFGLFDPLASRQLTVRDLLCHRSGLPRGDMVWYGSQYSRAQILDRVRYLEPAHGFRERFQYQNIMYLAAGQIIPRIDGLGWDAFMRERFFKPLGMARASTSTLELKDRKNKATPHELVDGKLTVLPWRNIDNIGPAGSINAGVADMVQWLRFNLNRGELDGKRIMPESAFYELWVQQMPVRLEGRYKLFFREAKMAGYGLGWFLHDYHGAQVYVHGGAIDGMRAIVMLAPDQNRGLVVLSNLSGNLVPTAIKNIFLDHWLGREKQDWSAKLKMVHDYGVTEAAADLRNREAARTKDTTPSLSLDAYTGTYSQDFMGDLRITREGDTMRVYLTDTLKGELEHWQHNSFRLRYDAPRLGFGWLNFQLDSRAQITGVAVEFLGDFTRQ